MRNVIGAVALVMLVLHPAGADEKLDKAALKELKALEGKWVVQRIETKDTKREVGEEEPVVLTIKGTRWAFGGFQEGKVVALDPASDPKTLDLKSVRKGREDTLNEAVYKITGD